MRSPEVAVLRTEISRLTRVLERALELSAGGSAFIFSQPTSQPPRVDLFRKPKVGLGGRALLMAARSDSQEAALREKFIPRDFCDGAAWNVLLHLLIARIEERAVSITDACSGANVAPTTALRCLTVLVEAGMCHRNADQSDARRSWIALSDKAYDMLAAHYEARRNLRWKKGANE